MIYEIDEIKPTDPDFVPKKTKSHKATKYHNVVIGAGLSGLLAAILVSKNRSSTLLIDKNNYIGGYIRTVNITQDDYKFCFDNWWPLDLSSDSEAFELLNYMKAFKRITPFKTVNMLCYINNHHKLVMPNDWKSLFSFLKQKYPLVSKPLEELFALFKRVHKNHFDVFENDAFYMTARKFLENSFSKDLSILPIFEKFWVFFGTSFDVLDARIFIYNMAHYFIGGFYYIQDGSSKFIATLEEICHVHGVNIKLNLTVKKIHNQKNKIKSLSCNYQEHGNKHFTIRGEDFVIASSLSNFVDICKNHDPTFLEYKKVVNNAIFDQNIPAISEIIVHVGLKNYLRNFKITEEIYYIQNNNDDSSQTISAIQKNGITASPTIIYCQNNIYGWKKDIYGSLLIKIYDIYDDKETNTEDIKNFVAKILEANFHINNDDIIYFQVENSKQLAQRLNRHDGNYAGNVMSMDNNWNNRSYRSVFTNSLIGSIDGQPGCRGNSQFLTAKLLSNVNNVELKKDFNYSDVDHMTSMQLLQHLAKNYHPHAKYYNKTIGITLDEKESFYLKLTIDHVEIKEVGFEKSMEANYYVWTFNTALKDIISNRSGIIKKVFSNKMRVKGGAFYLRTLFKKCFHDAILNKPKK